MVRHSLFLGLSFSVLLCSTSTGVLANPPTHTLFAVDVSLSAKDKNTAFEIIKETTLTAPQTHSIGLTLFDDTVRGFVASAPLDKDQIKTLHQAMSNAPVSVRATSNLSIGIERAIDAFAPAGGANLVVFARGVIDTKSDDPRAQFIEWLDEVLLQQATRSNIAISLVLDQNQLGQTQIIDVFAKADEHRIIAFTSGSQIAPELIGLLHVPDRIYGQATPADAIAIETSAVVGEDKPNDISDTTDEINLTGTTGSSKVSVLPAARLVLLIASIALLIGIIILRYRVRRMLKHADKTAHSSSTYLPLTKKPGETMDQYMGKETELAIKPNSRGKQ